MMVIVIGQQISGMLLVYLNRNDCPPALLYLARSGDGQIDRFGHGNTTWTNLGSTIQSAVISRSIRTTPISYNMSLKCWALVNTTNIEMGERTCRWTRVAIRSASFCHQITWTTMVYWCCYCLHQTSLPNNLPLNLPTGGDDLLVYTLYDHWPLSRSISSTRRLQHVIKTWVISFYSILLVIIPHDKVK